MNRYGEQEVCEYSGVIINSEESRLRDHKAGKNYRYLSILHKRMICKNAVHLSLLLYYP